MRYVWSNAIGNDPLAELKWSEICACILLLINLPLSRTVRMILYQSYPDLKAMISKTANMEVLVYAYVFIYKSGMSLTVHTAAVPCCVLIAMAEMLPQWFAAWKLPVLVKLISCGAFWIAFDLLDMKKIPDYMSHTFLIYAMHSLVGATLAKLLRMALPAGELFTALTALITFPMTVILICVFGHLITRYLPSVKRILCGR